MIFAGCGDNGGGSDPEPSPTPTPTPAPSGIDINMVSISGGEVTTAPTGDASYSGIFSNCGGNVTMTVSSFKIAESETPYSVWYAVRVWAEENGYIFANKGIEGDDGEDGAAPTEGNSEPVTCISWRDAIVWCNAYSAAKDLTPVYYTDAGYTSPLKVSTSNSINTTDGSEDKPYIKLDATGFRLPTEAQWEYAARGGNVNGNDWNDIYAGTNSGGSLSTYAVYNTNGTANVKSKTANAAQLYDMSGNVYEWCFDWYGSVPSTSQTDYMGAVSGSIRVMRGGSWSFIAPYCRVALRLNDYLLYSRDANIGFRVALPAD